MVATIEPRITLTATSDIAEKTSSKASDPVTIDVTRLPSDDDDYNTIEVTTTDASRTVLHIYSLSPSKHRTITPILSPPQERRFGPTLQQQKERRIAKNVEKKQRGARPPSLLQPAPAAAPPLSSSSSFSSSQATPEPQTEPDPIEYQVSYFLHTPYLSFHLPPSVLYTCLATLPSRYAPAQPVALIHSACFWRSYTIQLGASLSLPGVIDPRGVVSWAHNGGSASELKQDVRSEGRLLKGYRVRGWRLWGETGKGYVHQLRSLRKSGVAFEDPDVDSAMPGSGSGNDKSYHERTDNMKKPKATAEHVVRLTWTRPLSAQTRMYSFTVHNLTFHWKGTGSVSETRRFGWMLRYCHLKLVARLPLPSTDGGSIEGMERDNETELCLATYTSSLAAEKNGTLEIFDHAVLTVVEGWMTELLGDGDGGEKGCGSNGRDLKGRIEILKKSVLYQAIVATALCMASAEKEKRHTLIDLVIGIAENGGNGGG